MWPQSALLVPPRSVGPSSVNIPNLVHNESQDRTSGNRNGERGEVFHTPWKITLPESNIAPENWWLGNEFSFWDSPFSGAMLVSGRVTAGSPTNQWWKERKMIRTKPPWGHGTHVDLQECTGNLDQQPNHLQDWKKSAKPHPYTWSKNPFS